ERAGHHGVFGSALGFVLAAALIVPLALRMTGTGKEAGDARGGVPSPRAYLAALVPLAGAQLFTNLLLQVDITILGRFFSLGAAAAGLGKEVAKKSADEWVGVYRACQLFAFLPYQLLASVTQVLFPTVARAKAERDDEGVKRYVARGARIAAICGGLLVAF